METRQLTKNVASYTVEIVYDDGAYCVTVPALPGCFTWGKSLTEAERHAKEAIQGFIEALKKQGRPVPLDRRKAKHRVTKTLQVSV